MKSSKKLVLIDGSSYLFRAYHALPPLTNSRGIPTGAVYGVANMIRKLLVDEKPDYIACIFDTKSKNFRHEIYPQYKANRPEMPDDLGVQIEPLHQIIKAQGIPLLVINGLEADDVIATLAHQAQKKKIETVISTSDKDLAQLVDEHVTLINTMTGVKLDIPGVKAKFGIEATQMIDYLTLVGDTVDNIPGVPKVGPKTAVKWLTEYGSLQGIIQHANDIKGKVGEYLRNEIPNLPLIQELVTVKRDAEVPFQIEDLQRATPDKAVLRTLFTDLEFRTWIKELDENGESAILPQAKGEYELIISKEQLEKFLTHLKKMPVFAIELKTDSLDPFKAELVGIAISCEHCKAAYIPVGHQYMGVPAQLPKAGVLSQLKPILTDPKIGKIAHDCKYNMHVFAHEGISVQGWLEDTMLQSYVLNSITTKHTIDSLAQYYLKHTTLTLEEVAGKGAKQIPFAQVPLDKATHYAAEDADVTFRLNHLLGEQLRVSPAYQVYHEIEMPLVEVLWQMETYGIRINPQHLQAQGKEVEAKLAELEQLAFTLAQEEFNLGSPKQLQNILFNKLKLPILERTPTGVPSTAESVLQELSHDYELPSVILQHRSLAKLKSTYIDKLPLQINPKTQRVHTSYHQAVTTTGRLSSTDPNLQNIPIRTEEGRRIRQAFVPEKGWKMLSADYSQIELRIMAHLSQDAGLLKAFQQGEDIHRFTASEIFNVPLEQVSFEQRRHAKAINFGLIYGMSAFGLSRQIDVEKKEAQQYMDMYFQRYPGVRDYMENTRKKAQKEGYVETLFGRRLYLPEINSKNIARRRATERAAINAPMQGTAADIIKKAMIVLHHELKATNDARLLMQVHDELVLEVKVDAVEKIKKLVQTCMQNTVQLSVPLEVDVGVGDNWDEAH